MKYADAGVNLAVADDAKQRIRHLASRTFTPAVLGGIGGFGGLFALDIKKWKDPRTRGMKVTYTTPFHYGWVQLDNQDIKWVQDRTTAKNPGK